MRLFLITIFCYCIPFSSLAQRLQVEKEFNSSYYEFHEFEINLTSEKISIMKDNQDVYIENLDGKKIYKASPAENYFLIANFQFSNEKVDYPVEIKVFNRDGLIVFPYRFFAPFDLPHPLFSLNDNGELALFDPLSFKVKLIGQETLNEVELEKDVPFEMEKASFIEMNEDFLFVLTSQSALDVTENASNVKLYQVNIFDLSIKKKEIDYNTPTLLKVIGGYLFVSGVKFENLKPVGKTVKYDLQLNHLSSNEKIIEKLIPHGNRFYAKYFNVLYDLKDDISVANEKPLAEGERISDIAVSNEKLVVLTNISDKRKLYFFLPDLSIHLNPESNILSESKVESFSVYKDYLVLRNDSKSIKIKINDN